MSISIHPYVGIYTPWARQTAFDAEVAATERPLAWFMAGGHGRRSLIIHSGSTSAIARSGNTGAGPGQKHALEIYQRASKLRTRTVGIAWAKGHSGVPGNERADKLAGEAAEKLGPYTAMLFAHLKLKISGRFQAKEDWHAAPAHHGTMEIPHHPPRSQCSTGRETPWHAQRRRFGRDTGALRRISC